MLAWMRMCRGEAAMAKTDLDAARAEAERLSGTLREVRGHTTSPAPEMFVPECGFTHSHHIAE